MIFVELDVTSLLIVAESSKIRFSWDELLDMPMSSGAQQVTGQAFDQTVLTEESPVSVIFLPVSVIGAELVK